MVLSSSSIESRADGGDFFAQAARQGLYALVGVPAMLLAARAPMAFWKRWAGTAVLIGVALQLLVFLPGLGYERGQNRNWINLGSFTAQPSELIKLALVIWLAWVLSRKGDALHEWREVAVPILPIALVAVGLVLAGNDLGTATIIVAIVFGALFYAGVRLRVIAAALAGVARDRPGRDPAQRLPLEPHRSLAEPVRGPGAVLARLLAVHPRLGGSRARRRLRRRARQLLRQVVLDPGGGQRLHLRDHRRGAGPARRPRSCSPCSSF